ncbi:hypothetical protein R3X25_05395 [Lutibacter sp. TH_r2]|uniref:hypothetical protein n=1 Tax=Lutibacter sp. TH_r2 TaxID=3082083 RepID=UPI002955C181|nr:hypothetical protein [Lutibacter sp. TH_r2]MDV7186709.1 hypothetical protein [Lutibacter sp. TH_r2]
MNLSTEQIKHIDNYIASCGIEWIDVRAEIVDHFANSLEEKLEKTPNLNFKEAIVNEHKQFSNSGFKKLLKTKQKSVEKKFYKQVFKQLKTFFTLPKIIISADLFYGFILIMNLFSNKEYFFIGLTALVLLIIIGLIFRISNERNNGKKQFLILDKTNLFLQLFNGLMILFSNITTLRSEESFNILIYNYMQIGVFVVLLLFYWCAEYVFLENKKYVKTNYPKIAI